MQGQQLRVGFVGLGKMGAGIAENIQGAGFPLTVYNRTAEKMQPFDAAPFGIVGLETALALTITHLARPGHITLERAIELWTEAPRRVFGLPAVTLAAGAPADLVLFDPGEAWTVDPDAFRSKARNTPFAGQRLHGRVHRTVCAGRVTHDAAAAAPLR